MKIVILLTILIATEALAQDTRQVREPVIPPVCTSLLSDVSDETRPDTQRIQRALDRCPKGHSVELKADGVHNAFVSGPLELRAGVTLLVGRGATLFASRNPRDYDVTPGSCGVVNLDGRGCKPLIHGDHVADAGVMGDGTIDGRGGLPLIGQTVSWWDLAQQAKVKDTRQNCPRILVLSHCDNFTLYRIMLRDSPNFHVSYSHGNGFTAWGVVIDAPKTARNTDGIDPASSKNVTITRCFIRTGDDNIAIKAGSGGPSTNMSITHNHFYTGHGMSIGSETEGGASAIRVTDLSIDGADNGIRVKSNSTRGGLVHDVVYEDVCIRAAKTPIFMDSNYSFRGAERDKLPQYRDIALRNVRVLNSGKIVLDGFDQTHRLGIAFDNVTVDTLDPRKVHAAHAEIKLGPGPVSFAPVGEDVKITGTTEPRAPNACSGKFVPFPTR